MRGKIYTYKGFHIHLFLLDVSGQSDDDAMLLTMSTYSISTIIFSLHFCNKAENVSRFVKIKLDQIYKIDNVYYNL